MVFTFFAEVAGQIVFMQALHDDNADALLFVIKAAVQRIVVPVIHRLSSGFRPGIIGLERVVDNDDISAAPGQRPTDGGREPEAVFGCRYFILGILAANLRTGKDLLIPLALDDRAELPHKLLGQFVAIADGNDARSRILPQNPCRQDDRKQE